MGLPNTKGLSARNMATRVYERKDNTIKKEIIYDVLRMYVDEIRKALINGERVKLSGVGTLIPELKTHSHYNLPVCNNEEGKNNPYTRIRMTRTVKLHDAMNEKLMKNIDDGIYGLDKLSFNTQQMTYLKNAGFIPDDEEDIDEEDYMDEEEE